MDPVTTLVRPAVRLFAVNSTAGSYSDLPTTTTAPTGDGVIASLAFGSLINAGWGGNQYAFDFFGAGADNSTGSAKIWGWDYTELDGATTLWTPTALIEVDFTLGTQVGVAAAAIINTDRFADTVVLTSGKDYTAAYEIMSKADQTIAKLKVDIFGFSKIQVQLKKGTATNVNGRGRPF